HGVPPAAAGAQQRGVRGGLLGGGAAGRRRHDHADAAHRRADPGRPLLGLRRQPGAGHAAASGPICCWDAKYVYDLWRPVGAFRAGAADGTPLTAGLPGWSPLGAPRSNDPSGTNFTPPFPAYPSGHATFGAAAFRVLADFYGRDDIT